MALRIVRLGSPRRPGEGIRVGTVRRPPRGVPKAEFASRDFFDVWLPELAPSEALVKAALSASTAGEWAAFERRYRAELKRPAASRLLDLLAAFSRHAALSEVMRLGDDTHRRLVEFVQRVPESECAGDTRFRRRLRLDTYGHYAVHTRAIRTWRERRSKEPTRPPMPRG
jgi:uncharacterized protein YeaO (DUF488 family)